MDWVTSRRFHTLANNARQLTFRGVEPLEGRRLLAIDWAAALPDIAPSPANEVAVEQFVWRDRLVEARVGSWIGRLNEAGPSAVCSLSFPDARWTAVAFGNGFFSLSTPGASRQDVLAWAADLPGLSSFEPDFVMQPASLPDDPLVTSQWNVLNTAVGGYGLVGADLDATMAWDITTGSRRVVVAVIDSGIDLTHPDLAANIWTNPGEIEGNGLDDDGNGFVDDIHGWNFAAGNNDVQDGYGHGTHVAGIIGAVGNNGIGVAGLAWQVSIMPLRFLDQFGIGDTGGAIAALNYATMMRRDFGIDVVVTNASWGGGTGVSDLLHQAIRAHGDAGITFVAGAGNSAANCDLSPRYPACFDLPNVISVAASDRFDMLAGFSNYGANTIDLAAPGVGIYSTRPRGTYASMSGTSQAAPQVTGTIALLAAAKPDATIAQLRAAILSSVDPLPGLAGKTITGGRLNAAGALESLLSQSFTARARVGARHPLSGAIDTITISFNRPVTSGFDLTKLQLSRDGSPVSLVGATLQSSDSVTWTLGGLALRTAATGTYSLRLEQPAATADISGPDGEPLAFLAGISWSMANQLPMGAIDMASPVAVTGWALDPNAGEGPTKVQLWVNGKLTATVEATDPREELLTTHGSRNHGFSIVMPALPVGNHAVVVKALDPETGLFVTLGKRVVAVRLPVGAVETATSARFTGWAFSSRAGEAPVSLRMVINGRVYGMFSADVDRPELATKVGSTNHGFDITLDSASLTRITNTVQIWAIDPLTGRPTLIATRYVRR